MKYINFVTNELIKINETVAIEMRNLTVAKVEQLVVVRRDIELGKKSRVK